MHYLDEISANMLKIIIFHGVDFITDCIGHHYHLNLVLHVFEPDDTFMFIIVIVKTQPNINLT